VRATRTHATNLATFVFLYKSMLLLQKKFNGGKVHKADTFIAGLIGGYIVFGDRNQVNEQVWFIYHSLFSRLDTTIQIVLYVTSRVVATIIPRASPPPAPSASTPYPPPVSPSSTYFSIFAALTWGAVMYLFNERNYAIQRGMWSSMNYLYRDSDHWDSLRTLLWHNK
jgi:peroxisomal membrane protein 4